MPTPLPDQFLYRGRCAKLLSELPSELSFDLIIASPPYNIGKPYEQKTELAVYLAEQEAVITALSSRLAASGSLCWQVGNHIQNGGASRGRVLPLDILFHPIFDRLGFQLRNRIIWHFGHGLHCKYRFSGRYETILWYTKTDSYKFNLDAVRIPSKYPGKRSYKGPKKGLFSSHPDGKNPEDVWDFGEVWRIPNVKGNHVEKTTHPCQFPVGLAERLILALSDPGDLVFDPYAGASTTGVAATLTGRRYIGAEVNHDYNNIGQARITAALAGTLKVRSHSKPIYDHRLSKLSIHPQTISP